MAFMILVVKRIINRLTHRQHGTAQTAHRRLMTIRRERAGQNN